MNCVGICYQAAGLLTVVNAFAWKWPQYSGDIFYPIPGGRYAFYTLSKKQRWHGKQGRYRRSLCRFLAKELQEYLAHRYLREASHRVLGLQVGFISVDEYS